MSKPTCLIIGTGPGIGNALALAFAQEGFAVALMARSALKLAPIVDDVRDAGGDARAFPCDASDEAALRATIRTIAAEMGAPQILIYNIAALGLGKPTTLTRERLLQDLQVNVLSALVAAQEVAPAMQAAGKGSVFFTGGGFAYEPAANYSSLSLGKAALRNLTFSLAQELGAHGIHVATVTVYGFVQTGTHFDPTRIAQAYLTLHRQPKGHFQTELIYK